MKLRCDWQEHINERIEKPLRLFREWNVRVTISRMKQSKGIERWRMGTQGHRGS